jgi:hypothetical protein
LVGIDLNILSEVLKGLESYFSCANDEVFERLHASSPRWALQIDVLDCEDVVMSVSK